MTRYRTIVADPPWDHSDGTGLSLAGGGLVPGEEWSGLTVPTKPPYGCLTVAEICNLPVPSLAATSAHLYLWTTQRYLNASFNVVEAWGFRVSATLTWCKTPKGFMGGAYRSSTEFVHFARRGSLPHLTQAPSRWFRWPRSGHSVKPEAFLDMVEQVSPGPYLELFARRQRLGWDTWGDEALQHVELGS